MRCSCRWRARRLLRAAENALADMDRMKRRPRGGRHAPIRFGVRPPCRTVTYGNVGTRIGSDFTVIGRRSTVARAWKR